MEYYCCLRKIKPWFYSLLILLTILILMVCHQIQGGCIGEERKALLEIKTSLIDSYNYVGPPLPSWVDDGSIGGNCCDWERVKCNTTTEHVIDLSLSNMMDRCEMMWPLNVSLFLHFKELTTLNLSRSCLDDGILNTGLERLSGLNKLEILDLSDNFIGNETFVSLGALTSLRVLHLGSNGFEGYFPALALENLEILDLSNSYHGEMKGFERVSLFRKLKILNVARNKCNENLISSLSALPSLKVLNFGDNWLGTSFPIEELSNLTNLEELDLSFNSFSDTPSIQECTILSRLKKLKSIYLGYNNFNKSIISCLSALPSLRTLDLSETPSLGNSFPIQEFSGLPNLEVLILSGNDFNGTLPIEALASLFHHLEVLDLSNNKFIGSIPSTIQELSSLRVVSFANNELDGLLPDHGFCELKSIHELDLSGNMFYGSLPQCFNRLSSLKLLDISSNRFTGMLLPSLVANLTSLEYVDFSNNRFEGSFSFSSFSNNTKLKLVRFVSNNNKFEVETEEPRGWIPMFQLKLLVLSSCNVNRPNGSVFPRFLLHQHELQEIDLSHNSLVASFPNWLIENNTMLNILNLRNNSFSGSIRMLYMNANTKWLDMSGNYMNGAIPDDIQKFLPKINYLNLSSNLLDGVIPSSVGDMSELWGLDLSENELSGEVPKGLFTNISSLYVLKLSNNKLHGQILSGNISLNSITNLHLDSNCFTGKIGNVTSKSLRILDISNNNFTGTIPHWISNTGTLYDLLVSNNSLEGEFPCGTTSFSFLDISHNSFSGSIPSCLNFLDIKHLHLGSNRFTGSIPNVFRNLTNVLTLDIGNNFLSGRIPEFLGDLSNLRVLILRRNNLSGFIPNHLCELSNTGLLDLSTNSLSGPIPSCLQNIVTPIYPTFIQRYEGLFVVLPKYNYHSVLNKRTPSYYESTLIGTQDEVQFTTKSLSLSYKGIVLDLMVGLDLSCNKLTGEIPKALGLLTQIHTLNLSHNRLSGPIPMSLSNLEKIESLDLSSNGLIGNIPSQLIQLNYLSVFNVSNNNLSGRLLEMKAQFSTFTKKSYQGNPLLCGPPLEKKCASTSHVTDPISAKEVNDKWYDMDMVSFYGSFGSTWVVFLLGFAATLYINPYWRRRWSGLVEECMYTCYYFLGGSVRKLISMLFHK